DGLLLREGAGARSQRAPRGLLLPGPQAALARDRDPDARRRGRGRLPRARRADAEPDPRPRDAHHRRARARGAARPVRTHAAGPGEDPRGLHPGPDRDLPRARAVSRGPAQAPAHRHRGPQGAGVARLMAITLRAPRGLSRLAPALRRLVRSALAAEARRPGEIGIVLTRDTELRALNRSWRGIDRATDVLSFGYDGGRRSPATVIVSGDLVISLDRVIAQARRYRVSRGEELARLAVHGALHLAGLDHQLAAARRDMRRREDRALRAAA